MGSFRHTPDNIIYINNLAMPLSFFLTLNPAYALPAGYTSRNYIQGSYNILSTGSLAVPDAMPYADGDTYITNVAAYTVAYAAYLNPTPNLAQQKVITIDTMLGYAFNKKIGHVTVTGATYFSDSNTLQRLVNEDLTFNRAMALPVGYYVNDINYAPVAIAAFADLEAIIDRIVELHYLTDVNSDVHRAAINALATNAAVLAYDYTTGWPAIPY